MIMKKKAGRGNHVSGESVNVSHDDAGTSFIRGRQTEETIREEYFGTRNLDNTTTDFS